METKNISNKEKLLHAACYIPFGWIVLYFLEKNKSKELNKHIRYGTILFFTYIFVRAVFFFIFWFYFRWFIFLVYLLAAWFYWMKAYNWETFKIDYIDRFQNKVKDDFDEGSTPNKSSTNTTQNTTSTQEVKPEEKKDEFEWYDPDEDEWESVIDTGNAAMNSIAGWINKVVWDFKKEVPDEFDETTNEEVKNDDIKDEEVKKDKDVLDF